jgi:radical SAM-linked protein
VSAAPTGAASEAEYLEIGLTRLMEPAQVAAALDAALPHGVDVLDAVAIPLGSPPLADLIDATRWRLELPGVPPEELTLAVAALMATETLVVERVMKNGRKPVDVRAAVRVAEVTDPAAGAVSSPDDDLQLGVDGADRRPYRKHCAILTVVVRQTTPAVRPDDVLAALQAVADLRPPVPPMATRLAQGLLDDRGCLADPFGADEV